MCMFPALPPPLPPQSRAILQAARSMGFPVTREYEEGYAKAVLTFAHQTVFDPRSGRTVPLTPYTPLPGSTDDFAYLGPLVPEETARLVAQGVIHPSTKEPFSMPCAAAAAPPRPISRQTTMSNFLSRAATPMTSPFIHTSVRAPRGPPAPPEATPFKRSRAEEAPPPDTPCPPPLAHSPYFPPPTISPVQAVPRSDSLLQFRRDGTALVGMGGAPVPVASPIASPPALPKCRTLPLRPSPLLNTDVQLRRLKQAAPVPSGQLNLNAFFRVSPAQKRPLAAEPCESPPLSSPSQSSIYDMEGEEAEEDDGAAVETVAPSPTLPMPSPAALLSASASSDVVLPRAHAGVSLSPFVYSPERPGCPPVPSPSLSEASDASLTTSNTLALTALALTPKPHSHLFVDTSTKPAPSAAELLKHHAGKRVNTVNRFSGFLRA